MKFTGRTKLGKALNELMAQNRRVRSASTSGVSRSVTTAGTTIHSTWQPGRGGGKLKVSRYVITAVHDDYLECKPAKTDGTADTSAATVKVAKPKPLRVSSFNALNVGGWNCTGTSNSRRMTIPGATSAYSAGAIYDETLDPAYAVGDNDIYAAKAATGVTDANWIDLNASARRWVPLHTEVRVCVLVGGVATTKKMIVLGGPVYS